MRASFGTYQQNSLKILYQKVHTMNIMQIFQLYLLNENGNIKNNIIRDNSVDTLKLFFDSGKLSRLAVIENCSHSIIDGEGLGEKSWGDEAFYHDGIILEDICFDKNGKEVDCAILFKQKEN